VAGMCKKPNALRVLLGHQKGTESVEELDVRWVNDMEVDLDMEGGGGRIKLSG
jgi:hypothetical protein